MKRLTHGFTKAFYILFFLLLSQSTNSQTLPDHKYWSAINKLTVNDFLIKKAQQGSTVAFAQFGMDFSAKGFDFFNKTFNKQVLNYMVPTASWVDTTQDVRRALLIQQTLFDLNEVYTRRFRKQLKDSRRQLLKGTEIIQTLHDQILADLSKERMQFEADAVGSSAEQKQIEWTQRIQKELAELNAYAYEK